MKCWGHAEDTWYWNQDIINSWVLFSWPGPVFWHKKINSGIKKNQFKFPRCVGSCYCKVVSLACSVPCSSAYRNKLEAALWHLFWRYLFFQYYVFYITLCPLYRERFFPQNVFLSSFIKTGIITKSSVCSKSNQTNHWELLCSHTFQSHCWLCFSLQIESHWYLLLPLQQWVLYFLVRAWFIFCFHFLSSLAHFIHLQNWQLFETPFLDFFCYLLPQ